MANASSNSLRILDNSSGWWVSQSEIHEMEGWVTTSHIYICFRNSICEKNMIFTRLGFSGLVE